MRDCLNLQCKTSLPSGMSITGMHACPHRHAPCGSRDCISQQKSNRLGCACAVWVPRKCAQLRCASFAPAPWKQWHHHASQTRWLQNIMLLSANALLGAASLDTTNLVHAYLHFLHGCMHWLV